MFSAAISTFQYYTGWGQVTKTQEETPHKQEEPETKLESWELVASKQEQTSRSATPSPKKEVVAEPKVQTVELEASIATPIVSDPQPVIPVSKEPVMEVLPDPLESIAEEPSEEILAELEQMKEPKIESSTSASILSALAEHKLTVATHQEDVPSIQSQTIAEETCVHPFIDKKQPDSPRDLEAVVTCSGAFIALRDFFDKMRARFKCKPAEIEHDRPLTASQRLVS